MAEQRFKLEGGQVLIEAEMWEAIVKQDDELRAEVAQAREWSRQHHEMLEQALAENERLRGVVKAVKALRPEDIYAGPRWRKVEKTLAVLDALARPKE